MLNALLGRKIGMTQIFGANGTAIPVTVIEAGPCFVTQLKTPATDGYEAVQIGYGTRKLKNTSRAELGHLGHQLPQTETQRKRSQQQSAKARQEARDKQTQPAAGAEDEANLESQAQEAETQSATRPRAGQPRKRRSGADLGPFEILREVQIQQGAQPKLGEKIDAGIFRQGERVDVIGTTKGKGFAGVMKRHGFRGGKRTHGQSDRLRAPGSIGAGTTPGRVLKGTRMAGHMGHERNTIKALEIVQADPSRNLLVLKGSIPGPNGGIVMIRKQVVL